MKILICIILSVFASNSYSQIDTLNSYPIELVIEADSTDNDVFHVQLFDSTLSVIDLGSAKPFGRGTFRFSVFPDSTKMEYLSYPVSGYVVADPKRTNLFSHASIEFDINARQVQLKLDVTNQLGEMYRYVLTGQMNNEENGVLTNFKPSSCNEIMRCRWNRMTKLIVCVENEQLIVREDYYRYIKPRDE